MRSASIQEITTAAEAAEAAEAAGRIGVREAIQTCHQAGIEVAMVTGDHRVTALAIARELGLAHEASEVAIGTELADKSPWQAAVASPPHYAMNPRPQIQSKCLSVSSDRYDCSRLRWYADQ